MLHVCLTYGSKEIFVIWNFDLEKKTQGPGWEMPSLLVLKILTKTDEFNHLNVSATSTSSFESYEYINCGSTNFKPEKEIEKSIVGGN